MSESLDKPVFSPEDKKVSEEDAQETATKKSIGEERLNS